MSVHACLCGMALSTNVLASSSRWIRFNAVDAHLIFELHVHHAIFSIDEHSVSFRAWQLGVESFYLQIFGSE